MRLNKSIFVASTVRRLSQWALAAAWLLFCPCGLAFERIVTKDGVPIFWPSSCFYYSINDQGSTDIPFDELRTAFRQSFDPWEAVDGSYFYFEETAAAAVTEADFHLDRPNVNLLVFREDAANWPYDQSTIALTSLVYDQATGKILDADIEFNGAYFDFANQDEYPAGSHDMDLRNTATHEIGHTFGLDHTNVIDATMFDSANTGDIGKRTLHADDIAGILDISPLAEDPGVCKLPYCGLGLTAAQTGCANPTDADDQSCGCRTAGAWKWRPNALLEILQACFF